MLPSLPKSYSSCLNCKDRKIGCHSKCEKYKNFKKALDHLRKNQCNGMEYRSDKIEKIKQKLIKEGTYL